ncbi:STAS domain-containing protein [Streptomyces lavendofoliae]|uniref:Anti-sigma factor antagonist n=1 Tax=Streptomyces lavendofoliae TaxID=67314 RepID=A0A918M524_9ACTN|nr:STAS domain-containing protein [Streptomyces lavendofoliae]GGU47850.1 anti-sigma factor antagonist [Streptomyces lavendofoliae]
MEQSGLRVRVEVRPVGVGVVTIGGELDYDGVALLGNAIGSLRDQGVHCLLLDLSGMTFMDSSGVNAFLLAQRASRAQGGWVRLANPQPSVLRVIELVGLGEAIPLYATVGEALAA